MTSYWPHTANTWTARLQPDWFRSDLKRCSIGQVKSVKNWGHAPFLAELLTACGWAAVGAATRATGELLMKKKTQPDAKTRQNNSPASWTRPAPAAAALRIGAQSLILWNVKMGTDYLLFACIQNAARAQTLSTAVCYSQSHRVVATIRHIMSGKDVNSDDRSNINVQNCFARGSAALAAKCTSRFVATGACILSMHIIHAFYWCILFMHFIHAFYSCKALTTMSRLKHVAIWAKFSKKRIAFFFFLSSSAHHSQYIGPIGIRKRKVKLTHETHENKSSLFLFPFWSHFEVDAGCFPAVPVVTQPGI